MEPLRMFLFYNQVLAIASNRSRGAPVFTGSEAGYRESLPPVPEANRLFLAECVALNTPTRKQPSGDSLLDG